MSDHDDTEMREFTRGLFAGQAGTGLFSHREQHDEPVPPPKPAGYVAREGNATERTGIDPVREFVADLFGTDENARGLSRD